MANQIWIDENEKNPNYYGQFLCLVKWFDCEKYQYMILDFSEEKGWDISESCDQVLWMELPAIPCHLTPTTQITPPRAISKKS